MKQLSPSVRALRHGVAVSELDHVIAVRVSGTDAFDAMDRLCPRDLFLHDGQVFQTLFLHENGLPFADVLVGADDEDFLVFAEGPGRAALVDWMRGHTAGLDYAIDDLGPDCTHLTVHGPYAWQLLADLLGPEVVGLPYLTFFETELGLCLRTGKTGEFGYELLVPPAQIETLRARLEALRAPYDLATVDLADLDVCAMENWFFNIRSPAQAALNPLELQLRWRLSRNKEFVGSAALQAVELTARVTSVTSAVALAAGAEIALDGRRVGRVVDGVWSESRGDWVGLALIELAVAHPGLHMVCEGAPVTTVSAPFLRNRSLFVNPQQHRYATRAEDAFPEVGA